MHNSAHRLVLNQEPKARQEIQMSSKEYFARHLIFAQIYTCLLAN